MANKNIILLGSAILILLMGCSKEIEETSVTNKELVLTPVTILEVQRSDFFEYGKYYGRVQGIQRASIISMTGGTVETVNVIEGSFVSKGDSLALISSEKARITLDSAVLNEKINHDNFIAQRNFLKSGSSSQLSVDKSHLQWLNSETQLLDAEKAYNGAYSITPISGIVVSRNVDKDDEVLSGHESFIIEDLSQIEIKIGIPEADMNGIQEGNEAQISLDLFPNQFWRGELTRFSRKSSESNLTFAATIIVDNTDGKILSGTTANVQLLRNSYINHIVLPTDTIVRAEDGNYVMVLTGDTVNKRLIELGPSDVDQSVILSGLDAGEIIVREGLSLIIDSQHVSVVGEEVKNDSISRK